MLSRIDQKLSQDERREYRDRWALTDNEIIDIRLSISALRDSELLAKAQNTALRKAHGALEECADTDLPEWTITGIARDAMKVTRLAINEFSQVRKE